MTKLMRILLRLVVRHQALYFDRTLQLGGRGLRQVSARAPTLIEEPKASRRTPPSTPALSDTVPSLKKRRSLASSRATRGPIQITASLPSFVGNGLWTNLAQHSDSCGGNAQLTIAAMSQRGSSCSASRNGAANRVYPALNSRAPRKRTLSRQQSIPSLGSCALTLGHVFPRSPRRQALLPTRR